jgi:hypothetical protein
MADWCDPQFLGPVCKDLLPALHDDQPATAAAFRCCSRAWSNAARECHYASIKASGSAARCPRCQAAPSGGHKVTLSSSTQYTAWRAKDLESLAAFFGHHTSVGSLEIGSLEPEFPTTPSNLAALTRVLDGLPRGCTSLQLQGAVAVPYALYAAAERLPGLQCLTLQQLPYRWSYQEGALPWPRGLLQPEPAGGPRDPAQAAALAQQLQRLGVSPGSGGGVREQLRAAQRLHEQLYGRPVYGRFRDYWNSFQLAAAHLLAAAGRSLLELHLEAPARTLGLDLVSQLAAQGGPLPWAAAGWGRC